MKIDIIKNTSENILNVEGIIKSSENTQSFINAIDSTLRDNKNLTINIKDSFSVTSTVIGFLLQKVNVDKINLTINVGNDRLYELFDMLELISILNIKKSI